MSTKNQHYVPQFLLRRFATEEGKVWRTNVFDIARTHHRPNQNVKNVCAGNYTYDKDNAVESHLQERIEDPAAQAIAEIVRNPGAMTAKPDPSLLRFLSVQLARTPKAYEDYLEFANQVTGTMFAETARLNGQDEEAFKRVRVTPKEPRNLLSYMTYLADTNFRLLSDLTAAIVVHNETEEFIMSDHPVFQYNWYLRDSSDPAATSITVKGAQFFLPLAPTITYCLYDKSVYVYRTEAHDAVIRAGRDDVAMLNRFQAIGADSLLIARSPHMAERMKELGAKYANAQSFTSGAKYSNAVEFEPGRLRSTHMTYRTQVSLPAMPSFVKIKNKVRRRDVACEHRRPDIVLIHEIANAELKARRRSV